MRMHLQASLSIDLVYTGLYWSILAITELELNQMSSPSHLVTLLKENVLSYFLAWCCTALVIYMLNGQDLVRPPLAL